MDKELKIYFTSDIHGFFSPINYADGAFSPSGAACCFSEFERDGNTLVIDGGDTIQGSPFTYYLHKTGNTDNIPAKVMNAGGYDFITLGNHDFNYGKKSLEDYIDNSRAVCLCANVQGVKGVEKTRIVSLENGLKVGLTGVATHHINIWEKPENLVGITISEPVPAAAQALRELKEKGADITICIYHGGIENDLVTGEPLSDTDENQGWKICNELDFDILLTGHQHLCIENTGINGTHVCQTPDKASKYIKLCAHVGSDGRINTHSELISPEGKPEAEALALLKPIDEKCAQWLDTPVGHLSVELMPEEHIIMAENGCPIANFFNQVQLEASGAEISATSLGNQVKGFTKDVSIRDVAATYIYPNTLVTLEVDGSVIKQALERCAEYFALDDNGKPAVSEVFLKPKVEHYNFDYFTGIDAVIDIRKPVGQRVVSVVRNGNPLEDDRKYSLCMNNYRASGTGGYGFYKSCRKIKEIPTEISELIMDYISAHGNISVDTEKHLQVNY